MALQNFVDKVTTITHTWLNKIDVVLDTILDQATTKAEARTALSVYSQAEIDAGYVWMPTLSKMVEAGGLMSYGTNLVDDVRRGADLLARVLKGEKPAEIPVDRAAHFELAVNLKTAKAMGITIPPSIMLRADRVIE